MYCTTRVKLLVTTRYDYREIEAPCGSAAFDADGVMAPYGRYCEEHVAEADTDVRCTRCGVGGFKEYMLADHYLIDCED